MRVFVALPAYDGKVFVQTVRALCDEQIHALAQGVVLTLGMVPGCSLPHHARNQLARDFLASDCERLVFVDADVSWEAGAITRLAKHPVDICGGAYRYKAEDEGYPVTWDPTKAELRADPATGLLEVYALPGGLLSISRAAFEKMREALPDRAYDFHGEPHFGWFDTHITGGQLMGEDVGFCLTWRAMGEKVWLDPEIGTTGHVGFKEWRGHIGQWLKGRGDGNGA